MSATELLEQGQPEADTEEVAEAPEAEVPERPEAPPAQASEVEEIAREMGWAPQTEWKGPKESWKSAKEFIRHGTVIQRELKTRNDTLTRDYEQRFQRLDRATQTALTKQREQLTAQYDARKREAVRMGDEGAYEAAQRAENEALKNFDKEVSEETTRPTAPNGQRKLSPDVIDFGLRNKEWFNKDPVMTGAAVSLDAQMATDYPELNDAERLVLVENEIKRRFNVSGQQNGSATTQRQQVEGGLRPIKTAKGKDWESMPPEAKSIGDKHIKEGLFKDKADFAKSYWEQ